MLLQKINIPTIIVVFEPLHRSMGNPIGQMWRTDQSVPVLDIFKQTFPQSRIVGKILKLHVKTKKNEDPEGIERFSYNFVVHEIV